MTQKGHSLLAKVFSKRSELTFSKIQAGDGYSVGDVWEYPSLISPRLDGRIISVTPNKATTKLECILTNEALTEFLEFREVGVFALDPDEGEILFAYANAGERADYIGPHDGKWIAEEIFDIWIYTANVSNINAVISYTAFASEISYNNEKSGLKATNVEHAIDELSDTIKNQIALLQLQLIKIIRRMQSGIEPDFNLVSENYEGDIYFGGIGSSTKIKSEQIPYENAGFPEIGTVKDGLDVALQTPKVISWNSD